MVKSVDLTGQKFGLLTVIGLSREKGHNNATLWDCQCECGNSTLTTSTQLIKGNKKSCGCLRKQSPTNVNDLIGKKFGRLSVLERAGKTKNDNALWLCQCECGNKVKANGTSLKRGETISCGCLKTEQIKKARENLLNDKTIDGVQVPALTKKVRNDSGTGHKGIHRRIRKGKEKFEVSITLKGKRKYVGTFNDLDDAIKARKQAEKEYHEPYIKALEAKNERN